MMDTKKIASFYKNGAQILADARELCSRFTEQEKSSLYFCNCQHIYEAGRVITEEAHEIFRRSFPPSFSSVINDQNFDIASFYQLIEQYPEILAGCEDAFFSFVQQHVETNMQGFHQKLMFNWSWNAVYGVLSSEYIKHFVAENKPVSFEKMVLSLARYMDPVQALGQERSFLFFSAAAKLDYVQFKERLVCNLRKNQAFEPWIKKVLDELQ